MDRKGSVGNGSNGTEERLPKSPQLYHNLRPSAVPPGTSRGSLCIRIVAAATVCPTVCPTFFIMKIENMQETQKRWIGKKKKTNNPAMLLVKCVLLTLMAHLVLLYFLGVQICCLFFTLIVNTVYKNMQSIFHLLKAFSLLYGKQVHKCHFY